MKVVNRRKCVTNHFICLIKMMQIRHGIFLANHAFAVFIDGLEIIFVFAVEDFFISFKSEQQSVACAACWVRAIKGIDTEFDARFERCQIANA